MAILMWKPPIAVNALLNILLQAVPQNLSVSYKIQLFFFFLSAFIFKIVLWSYGSWNSTTCAISAYHH
jgi:hypothetical protein